MISLLNDIFALLKNIKEFKQDISQYNNELISTRLIRLFDNHGIHRNQIPRILGHGLTVADVQTDKHLLEKLNEDILTAACELLSARRTWLDGASKQIYPTYDFYKTPEKFRDFINSITKDKEYTMQGVLLVPSDAQHGKESLLLIEETLGYIEGKSYYRYYLCDNWLFSYWKSRTYLTACISMCWERNIFIYGLYLSGKFIDRISCGESILGWQGQGINHIYEIEKKHQFDLMDMMFYPDVFLEGTNPEIYGHGKSALNLWLRLESQGFMHPEAHTKLFIEELAKYQS